MRLRSCEDRAVVLNAGVVLGDRASGRTEFGFVVPGQIATYLSPTCSAIVGLEQDISHGVQRGLLVGGEEDWEIPLESVFQVFCAQSVQD